MKWTVGDHTRSIPVRVLRLNIRGLPLSSASPTRRHPMLGADVAIDPHADAR